MGINIQPPEHMNCSCSLYANKKEVFFLLFLPLFFIGFLNSGPYLIFFVTVNSVVYLNFLV